MEHKDKAVAAAVPAATTTNDVALIGKGRNALLGRVEEQLVKAGVDFKDWRIIALKSILQVFMVAGSMLSILYISRIIRDKTLHPTHKRIKIVLSTTMLLCTIIAMNMFIPDYFKAIIGGIAFGVGGELLSAASVVTSSPLHT